MSEPSHSSSIALNAKMKMPFRTVKPAIPLPGELPSPQQLFDNAAADKDYSKKASIRSLATRTVILTGEVPEGDQTPVSEWLPNAQRSQVPTVPPGLLARLAKASRRLCLMRASDERGASAPVHVHGANEASAFAVASIPYVEPGLWQGQKAHFIRLHVEYHPDASHHLERVDVKVRAWKAGDALKSLDAVSHLHLLSVRPPDAPTFGDEAPPIVLFGPRAVVGRPAGSKVEPYWDGHFRTGDHFIYYAEASAPRDLDGDEPHTSSQPRSVLDIAAYGDHKEMRPAPSFDVGMVILSEGKPFDLTIYGTSTHWGLRRVGRYLFDPYSPAKIGPSTRLKPKGERRIAIDFSKEEMKEKLMDRVAWCKPYDTVSTRVFLFLGDVG